MRSPAACRRHRIEVAKRLLAWYIGNVPAYSVVYGAFATVPILLVWIYIAWLIVLFGAVIAAYLPSLLAGPTRRPAATAGSSSSRWRSCSSCGRAQRHAAA
jgi:membrane protein